MTQEGFKRKLTAILSADAVGYSRLMGEDEAATVSTITSYRNIISTLIKQHNGTVIDSPGDNLLAEFASVVDAVQCAVAVQKEIKSRNDELAENRRMQFRIGINLGDVIKEENRIYGDGVNVAARLEGLAEPGGICISKTAFDHIESKLPLGYEFLGEQAVKNISKPVSAYRVLMEPRVTVSGKQKDKQRSPVRRTPIILGAAALLVLAVIVGIWQIYMKLPSLEPASVEKMAYPLPDKPSIAVLPFDNMSGDKEQEYFCDGITEDVITDLSKIDGIFVIARNSAFTYKGRAVKIKQIAEELGVRFILEGGVRKSEDKIRITAQLIDATSGHHLWADRYDGILKNVFELQDNITKKIVSALAVKLTENEQDELITKDTVNIEAYDYFLKAWAHYLTFTPDDLTKAIFYFEKAVELDQNYGRAYAGLARIYEECSTSGLYYKMRLGLREARKRALQYLEMAMKKKPTSLAHQVAANFYLFRRQHKEALIEAQRATVLDPNDPGSYAVMGWVLTHIGKLEEAVRFIEKGMRLDPQNPGRYLYLLGNVEISQDNYTEAVTFLERALRLNPSAYKWSISLAVAYANLGRNQEAEATLKALPTCQIDRQMLFHPYSNRKITRLFANGLLAAGCKRNPPEGYMLFENNRLNEMDLIELLSGREVSIAGFGFTSHQAKRWIDGNTLCYQQLEFPICGPVFSNPKDESKKAHEYFYLNDIWIYRFYATDE